MSLRKQFEKDMMQIYLRAKKECKYNASRYFQMLSEKGGIETARALIYKVGGTDGFEKLWELGRLDLTVEALVLKGEYEELFTDEERDMCKKRLEEFGYTFD